MKELTIKEKAQRYDEAIERGKRMFSEKELNYLFPELKKSESEDDVRRKSTIQVLEYARSIPDYNQFGKDDIDKHIAWLKRYLTNNNIKSKKEVRNE